MSIHLEETTHGRVTGVGVLGTTLDCYKPHFPGLGPESG